MDVTPGYQESHLIVAAIRLLAHRADGKPPTVDEVAAELRKSPEWCGVLVRELARRGILIALTGPFETRVEVGEHNKLEDLPRSEAAAGVQDELQAFAKQKKQEEEKLRNLFGSGAPLRDQEKKMESLADEFTRFKPKAPGSSPLFDDPPEK